MGRGSNRLGYLPEGFGSGGWFYSALVWEQEYKNTQKRI